jgi:hypothetical protein
VTSDKKKGTLIAFTFDLLNRQEIEPAPTIFS